MDPLLVRADYVGDSRNRRSNKVKHETASISAGSDYSPSAKSSRMSPADGWQQSPESRSSTAQLQLVPILQATRITGTFNSMALGCYSGLLADFHR
jgi:hypothetical protein